MTRSLPLILLLAIAPAAFADSEARIGESRVRISATACSDEATVAVLTADGENAADYRAATARFEGREFRGCWRPDFQKRVILLRYEDGDHGMVPFDDLKPVPTV
jgi:hypothetical protein